ncbi:MAG TPA: ATP-binding cassette domain-containing protein [Candidatus Polarisedimenticolaceae bacterium]|nr:ATP-binding cassette domain-containing protein [Candidatus Polarisedimenticolaceae bacterium]
MSALLAEGITHRFGDVLALEGVTLEVAAGECVALVGESGSGKTTLLGCFNRLTVPQSGRITVLGEDVTRTDAVSLRRRVGYVQQDGGLLPHWTVARNAGLVPWLRGEADARERATAALELVGLPAATFGARHPAALSGGQRQRVAIARAIAAHPGVLLMDEPFGALDAITRFELQQAFLALRRRIGATVLLVTHDLREAFLLADRVAVFRAGRIEQLAPPGDLQRDPATPYVRRLLETAAG